LTARVSLVTVRGLADPRDKLPENVSGRYYVDSQCIDCDVCRVTAPANFQRDEGKGYSFVSRQPATPEEEAQCQEAMDSCPVEAIGDDGAVSS
jgi:ferredoxin